MPYYGSCRYHGSAASYSVPDIIEVTTTVRRYIYDNEDILLELDGSNNIVARYTHGPGIDEPLVMEKGGASFFYHADGLGSITEITDSLGVVKQRYTYSSFGKIESELDPNFVQPYTFTAREFDPETGLYFYRARYYDPNTGRFLREDPIGFAGGLNFYPMVSNNPVRYFDPFGLTWAESIGLFFDWALGRGPEVRIFGPGTNQVRDLKDAPGVNAAREYFYQKNRVVPPGVCPISPGLQPVLNFQSNFGLTGLIRAGFDPTEQFVGSYRVDIYPNTDGTVQFYVTNTTSMTSFLYGLAPSWDRSTFGPGGNMTQIYTWSEPARR